MNTNSTAKPRAPRSLAIQQLDPLGTLDGRPISVAIGVGLLAFASAMLWLNFGDVVNPALAVASLLLVAITSFVLVVGTGSMRVPLTGTMYGLGVASSVIAFALSATSLASSGSIVNGFWGPMIIGITCITLAPYRPARELIAGGILATIFTGFIGLVQSAGSSSEATPAIAVLYSVTPVLTMSLGGIAFSRSLALSHQRWEARAQSAVRRQLEVQHTSVARSVQQDRVTILNRFVVPLFTDLAKRAIISPDDRTRAAEYSTSLRDLMVSEVNRSWLESVVASSFGAVEDDSRVSDPHRLALAMTAHQRTALRAAVLAIATGDELLSESVRIAIEKTETGGAAVVVHATVASAESLSRSSLAPYFAVLRVVFTGLQISHTSSSLTVRCTYDTP